MLSPSPYRRGRWRVRSRLVLKIKFNITCLNPISYEKRKKTRHLPVLLKNFMIIAVPNSQTESKYDN